LNWIELKRNCTLNHQPAGSKVHEWGEGRGGAGFRNQPFIMSAFLSVYPPPPPPQLQPFPGGHTVIHYLPLPGVITYCLPVWGELAWENTWTHFRLSFGTVFSTLKHKNSRLHCLTF
jgi:hypothetical protein